MNQTEEIKIIRLVHFTTEEFFRSSPETLFPNADIQISKICLADLSFDEFRDDCCYKSDEREALLQLFPLLRYCTDHWCEHHVAQHISVIEKMALHFSNGQSRLVASLQNSFKGQGELCSVCMVYGFGHVR